MIYRHAAYVVTFARMYSYACYASNGVPMCASKFVKCMYSTIMLKNSGLNSSCQHWMVNIIN
jgi:hypothetical protein